MFQLKIYQIVEIKWIASLQFEISFRVGATDLKTNKQKNIFIDIQNYLKYYFVLIILF